MESYYNLGIVKMTTGLNTQEFNKRWNITYRNVDSIRYLYYSEDKSLLDCLYNCLLWKLIVYDHKDI